MTYTPEQRQKLADEMTRIMADAEAVADTMTLAQIKVWAIANLTAELMAEVYNER